MLRRSDPAPAGADLHTFGKFFSNSVSVPHLENKMVLNPSWAS